MNHKVDATLELAKASPALTATSLILFGYPLTEWVVLGSFVLIALQLFFIVRDKLYQPWKDKRDGVQRCKP